MRSLSLVAVLFILCLPAAHAKTLLDRSNLSELLPGKIMYNDYEELYFLPDGTFLYHDREDETLKPGVWFFKQATFNYKTPGPYHGYEPTKAELKGQTVVCTAVNVSALEEFTWTPCTRLYKDKDRLYIAHRTMCNVKEPLENGVVHCNWTSRVFSYYRFKIIKE